MHCRQDYEGVGAPLKRTYDEEDDGIGDLIDIFRYFTEKISEENH